MSLLLYFLFPVQLSRGSGRVALVGTWPPARVNPPQLQYMTSIVTLTVGILRTCQDCSYQKQIILLNIFIAAFSNDLKLAKLKSSFSQSQLP